MYYVIDNVLELINTIFEGFVKIKRCENNFMVKSNNIIVY